MIQPHQEHMGEREWDEVPSGREGNKPSQTTQIEFTASKIQQEEFDSSWCRGQVIPEEPYLPTIRNKHRRQHRRHRPQGLHLQNHPARATQQPRWPRWEYLEQERRKGIDLIPHLGRIL